MCCNYIFMYGIDSNLKKSYNEVEKNKRKNPNVKAKFWKMKSLHTTFGGIITKALSLSLNTSPSPFIGMPQRHCAFTQSPLQSSEYHYKVGHANSLVSQCIVMFTLYYNLLSLQ